MYERVSEAYKSQVKEEGEWKGTKPQEEGTAHTKSVMEQDMCAGLEATGHSWAYRWSHEGRAGLSTTAPAHITGTIKAGLVKE